MAITLELLFLLLTCLSSMADWQLGTNSLINTVGTGSAANFTENGLHKFWWCTEATVSGFSGTPNVIDYAYYNTSTGQWSSISTVLVPTANSWDDGSGPCNPSVIKGSFTPGNGNTYSYAMYYVASTAGNLSTNYIGVAFSNDGVSWTKYSGNPVVRPLHTVTGSQYGAGEPSAYNSNGGAAITLFQFDGTGLTGIYFWRTSSDGIHFGTATPISLNGTSLVGDDNGVWPTDVGYDYNSATFYGVFGSVNRAGMSVAAGTGIYSMSASSVYSGGSGTWTLHGVVDTNLTGSIVNGVDPKLYRDEWGNVTFNLPNVAMYYSQGTSDYHTWHLWEATLNPLPSTKPFQRYNDPNNPLPLGDHWVTTGAITLGGYSLEATMGYLYVAPQSGTVPLFGCLDGQDHFVSNLSTCEGQYMIGVNGWLYQSQPQGISTQPLYRCLRCAGQYCAYHDHFVSSQSNCEGQGTNEALLGYSKNSQ